MAESCCAVAMARSWPATAMNLRTSVRGIIFFFSDGLQLHDGSLLTSAYAHHQFLRILNTVTFEQSHEIYIGRGVTCVLSLHHNGTIIAANDKAAVCDNTQQLHF